MEKSMHFEEESRLVQSSAAPLTPENAAAAGAVCARTSGKGAKILISHSGENGAAALASGFAAGAAASGADCIMTEVCPSTAAAYAVKQLRCSMGCYVHTEITASFKLFAGDGLSLFGDAEESISAGLGAQPPLPYSHYGSVTRFNGAGELYTGALKDIIGGNMNGIYADVSSSSSAVTDCCAKILEGKNDRSGSRISFHISGDGSRISAYSDETGYVFGEKLMMICCRDMFEKGMDIAVCGRPLRAVEKMAERYGRKVISCGRSICASEHQPSELCADARSLASRQMFTRDGIALMITVLEILRSKKTTLKAETDSLPSFAAVSRYIPVNTPSELLKRLCTVTGGDAPDGVLSDGNSGRVVIRPVRTGKGVMLSVESTALETASELCDFYSNIIKSDRTAPKM